MKKLIIITFILLVSCGCEKVKSYGTITCNNTKYEVISVEKINSMKYKIKLKNGAEIVLHDYNCNFNDLEERVT